MQRTSKGNLLISLKYVPQQEQIKGVVLKATNLEKQDIVGSAGTCGFNVCIG